MKPKPKPNTTPDGGLACAYGADSSTLLIGPPLCQCGCGQSAPIAKRNEYRRGWKKGQPVPFVQGHRPRKHRGYKMRRHRQGEPAVISIHRLRATTALGRPLPLGAIVHHADGTINEDAPLVICQDHAYHMLLHVRMRVLAAGGNPNTERICARCKRLCLMTAFSPCPSRHSGIQRICRPCVALATRIRKTRQRAVKVLVCYYSTPWLDHFAPPIGTGKGCAACELSFRDGDAGDCGTDPLIARGKPCGPDTAEDRGDLSLGAFAEALAQLKRETDKHGQITELPWRPSRV